MLRQVRDGGQRVPPLTRALGTRHAAVFAAAQAPEIAVARLRRGAMHAFLVEDDCTQIQRRVG